MTAWGPTEWSAIVQAASAALIVGLTIALIFVGWKQRQTYEEQRKLMKAVLKNTQNTDRAWVSLEILNIAPLHRKDGRMVIVGLRNSGRTPARIVEANITIRGSVTTTVDHDTSIDELAALPDEPIYDPGDFVPPAMLVAGEITRWRHVVTDVSDTNFAFLTMSPGDEHNLWIYGFVKYTDIYNPNRPHEYRFGREYDRILSAHRKKFAFAHLAKPKYNAAD